MLDPHGGLKTTDGVIRRHARIALRGATNGHLQDDVVRAPGQLVPLLLGPDHSTRDVVVFLAVQVPPKALLPPVAVAPVGLERPRVVLAALIVDAAFEFPVVVALGVGEVQGALIAVAHLVGDLEDVPLAALGPGDVLGRAVGGAQGPEGGPQPRELGRAAREVGHADLGLENDGLAGGRAPGLGALEARRCPVGRVVALPDRHDVQLAVTGQVGVACVVGEELGLLVWVVGFDDPIPVRCALHISFGAVEVVGPDDAIVVDFGSH